VFFRDNEIHGFTFGTEGLLCRTPCLATRLEQFRAGLYRSLLNHRTGYVTSSPFTQFLSLWRAWFPARLTTRLSNHGSLSPLTTHNKYILFGFRVLATWLSQTSGVAFEDFFNFWCRAVIQCLQ
jgi:hypothetical protein